MEWTTVYVSSVTNAMRGKKTLEQKGLRVYMQRSSHLAENEGCGYRLLVNTSGQTIQALFSKAGIRILRMERGGDPR